MKTVIIIILLSAGKLLLSQEPSLIHYNFSFEKEYGKGWNDFNLSNDLVYFTIRIFNSRGERIYNRHIEKPDFVKDKYGDCLMIDTIKTGLKETGQYKLSIKYKLVSGFAGKSKFTFKNSDSIRNIALEIFFDQAKLRQEMTDDSAWYWSPLYDVIKNPKPALIVKYLNKNENVEFVPVCFDYFRLTRRPVYVFTNTGIDTMFIERQSIFSGLRGYLDIMDITGIWKPYFFGAACGNGSGPKYIAPGENYYLNEANAIGNPLKLRDGFYRYAVNYLDIIKNKKTAVTYFSVMYSK